MALVCSSRNEVYSAAALGEITGLLKEQSPTLRHLALWILYPDPVNLVVPILSAVDRLSLRKFWFDLQLKVFPEAHVDFEFRKLSGLEELRIEDRFGINQSLPSAIVRSIMVNSRDTLVAVHGDHSFPIEEVRDVLPQCGRLRELQIPLTVSSDWRWLSQCRSLRVLTVFCWKPEPELLERLKDLLETAHQRIDVRVVLILDVHVEAILPKAGCLSKVKTLALVYRELGQLDPHPGLYHCLRQMPLLETLTLEAESFLLNWTADITPCLRKLLLIVRQRGALSSELSAAAKQLKASRPHLLIETVDSSVSVSKYSWSGAIRWS